MLVYYIIILILLNKYIKLNQNNLIKNKLRNYQKLNKI